jgi:hypothetical protein
MELKQFNLVVAGDQMSTSGNMTLNEVASALITLAHAQGIQDGAKPEPKD